MKKGTCEAIARLDERLKGLHQIREIDAAAVAASTEILRTELARRLDLLNGEQERIALVLGRSVSREMFDLQHAEVVKRVDQIERAASEQHGKLWLPLLVIGGLALAIGSLAARMLFHG